MFRRSFILFIAGVCLNVAGAVTSRAQAEALFIFSYADWCVQCKVLRPVLEEAILASPNSPALITLDFTDTSPENLYEQFSNASPMTADDFLLDGKYLKTGFAFLLVNGEVIAEITSVYTVEDILTLLDEAQS